MVGTAIKSFFFILIAFGLAHSTTREAKAGINWLSEPALRSIYEKLCGPSTQLQMQKIDNHAYQQIQQIFSDLPPRQQNQAWGILKDYSKLTLRESLQLREGRFVMAIFNCNSNCGGPAQLSLNEVLMDHPLGRIVLVHEA